MKSPAALLRHPWIQGVVRFVIMAVVLGWLYSWAAPRAYPSDRPLGFVHGMMHGAFMPMALPALVMGHDVMIYAPNNTGRFYKLGYIAGINVCGLIFFGSAFWHRPTKAAGAPPGPLAIPASQKNGLR